MLENIIAQYVLLGIGIGELFCTFLLIAVMLYLTIKSNNRARLFIREKKLVQQFSDWNAREKRHG